MQHEIVIRLAIWDFQNITHDQISAALEKKPTKTYTEGQPRSSISTALSKTNGWLLELTSDRQEPFESQMQQMLDWLVPKRDCIYQYSQQYRCEISCALFLYFENGESIPSVHLDKTMIRQLNELALVLDFDIYCLPNT